MVLAMLGTKSGTDAEVVKLAVTVLVDTKLAKNVDGVVKLAVNEDVEDCNAACNLIFVLKFVLKDADEASAAESTMAVVIIAVVVELVDNRHEKAAADAPDEPTASEPIALFPIIIPP